MSYGNGPLPFNYEEGRFYREDESIWMPRVDEKDSLAHWSPSWCTPAEPPAYGEAPSYSGPSSPTPKGPVLPVLRRSARLAAKAGGKKE